jgi:hypothetical protein
MKPEVHRVKAERIARSMQKLNDAHYEMLQFPC